MMRWWVEKIARNQLLPGRWQVKKDIEKWMSNYHPDPGYDNLLKEKWLENQKHQKDERK